MLIFSSVMVAVAERERGCCCGGMGRERAIVAMMKRVLGSGRRHRSDINILVDVKVYSVEE